MRITRRRSASIFSDSTLSPSFFFRAPAMAPRTVCACHCRASTTSAMVAPSGRFNTAISLDCLLSVRGVRSVAAAVFGFAFLVRMAFFLAAVFDTFDMVRALGSCRPRPSRALLLTRAPPA